jgi:PAS domain S-box-containing protein
VVYAIAIIISIIIAYVLFNFARLSDRAVIIDGKKKISKEYLDSSIPTEDSIRGEVFEEISKFVDAKQHAQKVSKAVSDIFSKELEKKINLNNQELSKKYNTIIEQRTQSEEIAWKKYKKVLSEKRDTETVIRNIAEGLVVVNAKGRVIMMNPAAEKLLGVSKKEIVGKPISDNLKEEQLISLVKDSQENEEREIEVISQKDETKKILRASSAVIENENGQTVGMVSVLSDITKQKELDRLKSNFISSISHELRTPLVAMEKSISLILNRAAGPLSKTQEEFLSISERNLKRLSRLIDDLLDLSKLEAGKMELRLKPSLIEKIINESVEGLDTWSKTKSINIERKIQEGIPEVSVDSDKIIQVLNNLIGNAIKFTHQNGNISIEAVLKRESREVEVSVADTGIGIPQEALGKIFDKFYQVGERVATDISGTGIGLSIVKEIVELHGGKIWAESEKGQGAKFTFTLPLSSGNG